MSGSLHVVGSRAFLKALINHGCRPPRLMVGISTLLTARAPGIVSLDEIIEWIWGDDPNGGPDHPANCIRQAVFALRRNGAPIVTHSSRGYSMERAA